MPLPFILGAAAAVAGAVGVGSGIRGAAKLKEAKDTVDIANSKVISSKNTVKYCNERTLNTMDELGKIELEVLKSFEKFTAIFEQIHNKPEFKKYDIKGVDLPKYDFEKLKNVSIGAGILLGGLGGAGLGVAGGFAAAGATTSAVMALGTASTGVAISSLSGVAETNATLAALGGGAIAAGGGGMALGTTILGATTLGAGILVGGIIFNLVGSKVSDKADEALGKANEIEENAKRICHYLDKLNTTARKYKIWVSKAYKLYKEKLENLSHIVYYKKDWNEFNEDEKLITENISYLVGLLYNMCKVKLVLQSEDRNGLNVVNTLDVEKSIKDAENVLNIKLDFID